MRKARALMIFFSLLLVLSGCSPRKQDAIDRLNNSLIDLRGDAEADAAIVKRRGAAENSAKASECYTRAQQKANAAIERMATATLTKAELPEADLEAALNELNQHITCLRQLAKPDDKKDVAAVITILMPVLKEGWGLWTTWDKNGREAFAAAVRNNKWRTWEEVIKGI